MQIAYDIVAVVDLAIFFAVTVLAVLAWRRRRTAPAGWAALVFLALAIVFDGAQFVTDDPHGWQRGLQRVTTAALLCVPYLLFRFTASFERAPVRGRRLALGATLVVLGWVLAVPHWPQEGEPWPAWAIPFLVLALGLWLVLTGFVIVRLWRGGGGRPGIARRRMRSLALAVAALTAAVYASVGFPGEVRAMLVAVLAGIAAVSFLVALSPPATLRTIWRRREQERLYDVVGDLVAASDSGALLAAALPAIADLVGADALALHRDGVQLGSTGDALAANVVVPLAGGELHVRTSPYAPYFGDEELALLRTVGALTLLAVERARTLEDERAARQALERADELKSQFVSLAAHELRGPVGTVDGIAKTLELRAAQVDEGRRAELRGQLSRQTGRLVRLVEQLLDLSRLDADAIAVEPRPLAIRPLVERLLEDTGGAGEVEIEVDGSLEAVADPDVVERVVSNLVANALKYGELPVVVRAAQDEGTLRIEVEDAGDGVPQELSESLFERFTRGAEAAATTTGTGLGLAIARSYAIAHGGDLVYSPGADGGARFRLVLPAPRADTAAAVHPSYA